MEISPSPSLSLSLFVSLSGYDRYSNLGADSFFSTPIPRIDETLVNLHPSRCVRGRWFEGHINSRAACFSLHARTHTHIHADRYHVSYPAFCHGEIHSTIFHLSRPGSGKELMRDSAGDGTSRVGGSKKRRHVARWILVGREGNDGKWGGMVVENVSAVGRKFFSVFEEQTSEQGEG